MINSLKGIVTYKSTKEVFLENSGVEWTLIVSERSAGEIPLVGEEARIFAYLHHREDQMTLFGFATKEERFLFHDLLRVGGIGPKQAIRILSGMSVDQFIKSLDADDIDSLSRIPGLGKKTSQKIILTLRGRLTLPEDEDGKEKPFAEIVTALIDMGFEKQSAANAVQKCVDEIGKSGQSFDDQEKEIFRRTIVALSSNP